MYRVIVKGLASNNEILNVEIDSTELNLDALTWLRSRHIPIASSCFSEGLCKKCLINGNLLACKTNLLNLVENNKLNSNIIKINVSYL